MSISGYGVRIRSLRKDDVDRWSIDLQGHDMANCIAIDGEDLGHCLAAVIAVANKPVLLWSDNAQGDFGKASPMFDPDGIEAQVFCRSVIVVTNAVHPYLELA